MNKEKIKDLLTIGVSAFILVVVIGISLVFIFYLVPNLYLSFLLYLLAGIFLATNTIQFYSLLSFIFIYMYNGEKGKSIKYFFYLYYPLHLLILKLFA